MSDNHHHMEHPENDEAYKGLTVNAGIEQPASVNPYLVRRKKRELTVPDYVEENVSTKVVKLIQSYTGVVNKMVWRKF